MNEEKPKIKDILKPYLMLLILFLTALIFIFFILPYFLEPNKKIVGEKEPMEMTTSPTNNN